MPRSRQIRLYLPESVWQEIDRQRELGHYRSIANTIAAQLIRYQESFSSHLSAPYLPQHAPIAYQSTPILQHNAPIPQHNAPVVHQSSPKLVKVSPVNPNNPNGF